MNTDNIYHPGEVVHGTEDGDLIDVDVDPNQPNLLLVGITEADGSHAAIYLRPESAREYGQALIAYADHVKHRLRLVKENDESEERRHDQADS